MRIQQQVPISDIESHLKRTHSGVSLPLDFDGPSNLARYVGYRALLDQADLAKLVQWFEFEKHSLNGNCRISDTRLGELNQRRVNRLLHGDPECGLAPIDLRSSPELALVIVTDSFESDLLYIIDGNHRANVQFALHRTMEDVPVYVCIHPAMRNWAYIPNYYKREMGL